MLFEYQPDRPTVGLLPSAITFPSLGDEWRAMKEVVEHVEEDQHSG